MKVIIAGGRDLTDIEYVHDYYREVYPLVSCHDWKDIEIVSGGARGADKCGEAVASIEECPLHIFLAEWDKYGKSAGYIRNAAMAEYADALLAFWDGKSKGTKHMIDIALKKGLDVHVYRYVAPPVEIAVARTGL